MIALHRLVVPWRSISVPAGLLFAFAGAVCFVVSLSFLPKFGPEKPADERAALRSMRAIQQAEMEYASMDPAQGFVCELAELSGDAKAGAPSPAAAQLIPADLASGTKLGYFFSVSCTDRVIMNGIYRYDKFEVTAVPVVVGKTGTRGFCGDQFANIQFDPAGGSNCTQPLE